MLYSWLPPLIRKQEFESDEAYYNALYAIFKRDFIDTKQFFKGLPINIKRHPPYGGIFQGKEATFRHLITEGANEATRQVIPARCERIAWMWPVLNQAGTKDIKIWENKRKNDMAYVLALSDFSYKLVLKQRNGFLLLWTHVPLQFGQERQAVKREYERLK